MSDKFSILLVDDDVDVLEAWSELLSAEGFTVLPRHNGMEAWEALRTFTPDIVLTDWSMPLMDGAQLCYNIKCDPELCSVPVVIWTGNVLDDVGPNDCAATIQKPVAFRKLVEVLANAIKHRTP